MLAARSPIDGFTRFEHVRLMGLYEVSGASRRITAPHCAPHLGATQRYFEGIFESRDSCVLDLSVFWLIFARTARTLRGLCEDIPL
jgi:hypothetical protein